MFNYRLKTETELVPLAKGAPLLLEIDSLANLDETIDQLFEHLKKTGDERLLEELCPYFGTVWPAARGLAAELGAMPLGELRRGRWLEVGCGLAVPSLALAKLGADVTATDFHPEVPSFLERNVARNQIDRLPYRRVDWQAPEAAEGLGRFERVIGSDILYEKQHPEQVAQALARLIAPGGTAIVADPGRPYLQPFSDAMEKLGFKADLTTRMAGREIFLLTFSL